MVALEHLTLIVIGCIMIYSGVRARRIGYFKYLFKIGKSVYYRDKDPLMFSYLLFAHTAGGGVIIVLSLLSWMGMIEVDGLF